jgi:signal transduction histidine kinase
MSNLWSSIRLRTGVIFIVLASLVLVTATIGLHAIAIRNGGEEIFTVADSQGALAYKIAILASSLSDTADDSERASIGALLQASIDTFDSNQKNLRDGDLSNGVIQLEHTAALDALDRVDSQWTNFQGVLRQFLGNVEDNSTLLRQVNTQATSVYVYSSEFAEAVDVLINTEFDNVQRVFTIAAAVTIFVLIISFIVLAQIARSLGLLMRAAQAYARGEYDTRVNTRLLSEVAEVNTVLSNMAQSVASREAELKEVNSALEQRVLERTVDFRKARDEAIAASQLANESSRLKSEFLATMSHELRTPLNAIEGFTSIMLGNMGIELPPRARTMVERVSANSKRLLNLINDFLDLSRIESGRLELVNHPVTLHALVKRWMGQVQVLADQKKLALNVELDPAMPLAVLTDEEALSKIAINLLGNAFKFTQEGSVSLSIHLAGNTQFALEVRDTGIGIPVHARDYIFEEFRQVDGSSKRQFGGTGLGLAIVQKFARAMGGTVSLQSELGVGSTFTVTLPLEAASIEEGITA